MRQHTYSDDELVALLRRAARKLGRKPRSHDLISLDGVPTYKVYRNRFGSWPAALRAAGFEEKDEVYTTGDLLDALRRLAVELGRTPCASDLRARMGHPNTETYRKRFGFLSEALRLSGVTSQGVQSTNEGRARASRHRGREAE